jgi:acetylornithine deacetylase/succinyl-diaminopimelate desuccinylase-like protein
MIKKTISLVLAIILSASILACGGKNASENKAGNSAREEGGAAQTASAAADPSGSENAPGAEEEAAARALVERVAATSYIAGSRCEVTLKSKRVPMVWSERNVQLLADMNAIFLKTGLPTAEGRKRHGGSDAAEVTACGIPCIDNMGVTGEFLHSVNEYMELCSLAESAKRIAAVMAYL